MGPVCWDLYFQMVLVLSSFELRVDPWASWECIGCFEYGDTSILDQSKKIDHSIIF